MGLPTGPSLTLPPTSKVAMGAVDPMPTLPSPVIRIRSLSAVALTVEKSNAEVLVNSLALVQMALTLAMSAFSMFPDRPAKVSPVPKLVVGAIPVLVSLMTSAVVLLLVLPTAGLMYPT